jgi:small subunit ribosomal protein S5
MTRQGRKKEERKEIKELEKRPIIEPEDEKAQLEIRELSKEEKIEKRKEDEREEAIARWVPKTKVGKDVKELKITNIDEILETSKILEFQLVDKILPLRSDMISIGQSKGKFGGGKRRIWRQTQKKSAEGNVTNFGCMAIVGDMNGHVGLGYGKARETLPSKEKSLRDAKLNIMKVKRGCGSFDCACNELHSIPYAVEGKCGSAIVRLIPAPKGTGLVIEDECKKILKLAGIKDIYSRTFGQTNTKINLAKACIDALKNINKIKK